MSVQWLAVAALVIAALALVLAFAAYCRADEALRRTSRRERPRRRRDVS